MAEKKKDNVNLLSYDPVETPEEVISADKDIERKTAFQEAYKRIAKVVPEYFMSQRKKRKNATSGGGISQNIVVTPEKVELKINAQEGEKQEKEEMERE